MENILYIIAAIFSLLLIYKVVSFLYVLKLKNLLKNGDFNRFVHVLGENHQYRPRFNGLVRYKWSKGLVVIKANFDEAGQLVCHKIQPRIILSLKTQLLFVA